MKLFQRRRGARILIAVLVLTLVCVASLYKLHSPRQFDIVPRFSPIRPPAMIVTTINKCTNVEVKPVLIAIIDVLPCYTGNEYIYTVHATASELSSVVARPRVFVRIGNQGEITELKLLRSSGNENLDQRTLETIRKHRHNGNYCVRCGALTTVNVEWNGPLWFREN